MPGIIGLTCAQCGQDCHPEHWWACEMDRHLIIMPHDSKLLREKRRAICSFACMAQELSLYMEERAQDEAG